MKDIRKKLEKKKIKKTIAPFSWFYHTVIKVLVRKQNLELVIEDDINECEGGCFLIFNHLSRLDHMYACLATYPKKYNMVAGYNEFFRSHLHTVFDLQRIIPKKNYQNELQFTKNVIQAIKQGHCVAFSPEGLASNDGMNKPVVPGTGKLLKKMCVPVYYLELHGQYLQNTKACLDERHGKVYATLKVLFSPDDLKNMTDEEIDNKMNVAFKRDEYLWQKEKHIKWEMFDRSCEGLGNLLYRCPKCGKYFTMEGKGNTIRCGACGNGATLDEYYDFHPLDDTCVIPALTSTWVNEQRVDIIKEIRKNPHYEFKENVKIGVLPNDHYLKHYATSEIVANGQLIINHEGVFFVGNNTNKYDFQLDYKQIYTTFTVLDASFITTYVNGEYTDIFPERGSALFMNTLIEEMHRLHVNHYKNFPWNDWMYEEDK